jgi:hypothetical protein
MQDEKEVKRFPRFVKNKVKMVVMKEERENEVGAVLPKACGKLR